MNVHRCRFIDYTPATITAISFLNEKCLAVGRSNGDIEIWNPTYWIQEQTLKGGRGRSIESLAWSVTDNVPRLFSIGGSTTVTEWDVKTGRPLTHHDCHSGVIWSLAVSRDNSQLAVGCDNGSVTIISIEGGRGVLEHLRILQRCNGRVMSLAYKGDNQVVGGCSDGKVRVWSTQSSEFNGRIVATMRVDKSRVDETLVWAVLSLREGKIIVSGDSTGSVKIWDGTNYSLLQSFKIHEADVLCLAADSTGDRIFSGGSDRKIIHYRLIDNKSKRYTNIGSRMVHAHDIRAMDVCCAESLLKGKGLLVSGGVEKAIVLNSIKDFPDGMYRKIPISTHSAVVGVCSEPRLAYTWTNQMVKIWKIDEYIESCSQHQEEKGTRIVSKMSLANEENITSCDISPSGSHLVVCTLSEIKLFELSPGKNGNLKIEKMELLSSEVDDNYHENIADIGAKIGKFTPDSSLLILVTADSQLYSYSIQTGKLVEFDQKRRFDTLNDSYCNIFHLSVSPSGRYIATATLDGHIDIFDLKAQTYHGTLPKTSQPLSAIHFTNDDTLIVVTVNFRILEFSPKTLALTAWSRRNWDIVPRELTGQVDRCIGIFVDQAESKKVWLWGASWLGCVDRSLNFPNKRSIKKRKLDGEFVVDEVEEEEEEEEEETVSSCGKAFSVVNKYRPILFADSLGAGEIFVSERPAVDISLPPAFWSNHKIVL